MAVTVEELQIVLQCDATQAQAALNSLNASVDKAVKKMNSGGGKGGASYYETVSKKIQAAMEKASEAMDEFESTGDSGAKANLGHYTTEANKLAKELQKCRDAASLMFGEKKKGALGDVIEDMAYKLPKAVSKLKKTPLPKLDEYLIGERKGGALGNAIEDMAYKLPKAVSSRLKKMPKLDEYLVGEAWKPPTIENRGASTSTTPYRDQWNPVSRDQMMSGYNGDMMRRAAAWMDDAANEASTVFERIDTNKLTNGTPYERLQEQLKVAENQAESLRQKIATIGETNPDPQKMTTLQSKLETAERKAEKLAKQMAALEDSAQESNDTAENIEQTGDAAEEATPKVERYANATRKTGKSFSFFSRLSKAAHGIFDKFGKSIRKHEGFFEKFGKTLKRVVMRMLAMGLVRGVINGMRQGLQLLAKSSDTAAQQFGRFTALGKAVKAALGSAALAALNAMASVLYSIASAAVTAANAVAQFFAVIGGTGKYIGVSLSGNFDDLKDSIDGAGGAAKGLLADFDELNIIGSKGGGGGGGLAGIGGITSGEQDAHSPLADLLLNNQFTEAGAYIAQKLDEVVLIIDNWFIELGNKHYGTKFAEIVNGIFSDKQLFEDTGKTVGDGINVIIHAFDEFTETFDGKEAGEALAAGVNTMVDTVDWESAGDSVSQGLNKITDAIEKFFTDFDGDALGMSLATTISNAIVGIDASKIGAASTVMLINAIDFVLSFLANMDWVGILSGLVEFILSAPVQIIEGICARPSNLIRIIKNLLVLLAKVTWGALVGLVSGIIQGVANKIVAVVDAIAPGLIDKIAPWMRNIGDTINEGFNEGVDKAAGALDLLANYVDEKMGYVDDSWKTHSNGIEQSTDSMVSALDSSKGILDEYKSKMEDMATATNKVSDAMNNIPNYKESTIKINTVVTSSGSASGGAGGGKPNVNITLMKMAQGGIAYGSTLANIGEYPTARSNPEVVAPLSNLRKILESGKGGVNSADVRKQNELLQEQNRLLRVIAQKELRISPSPELGQVVTKSQALFGNV